jgi:hypothetical protein
LRRCVQAPTSANERPDPAAIIIAGTRTSMPARIIDLTAAIVSALPRSSETAVEPQNVRIVRSPISPATA